jgi:hypothetical protein
MNKKFIDVFLTNALLKMSILDQKYWVNKIDINSWHKGFDEIRNEMMEFVASSEPTQESQVL